MLEFIHRRVGGIQERQMLAELQHGLRFLPAKVAICEVVSRCQPGSTRTRRKSFGDRRAPYKKLKGWILTTKSTDALSATGTRISSDRRKALVSVGTAQETPDSTFRDLITTPFAFQLAATSMAFATTLHECWRIFRHGRGKIHV
jgi:hypothetical protein